MGASIISIGTANPANGYDQSDLAQFMCDHLTLSDKEQQELKILYRATGIQKRYSVLEDYKKSVGSFTFYPNNNQLEPFPSTDQRMKIYREKAVPLAIEAVMNCTQGQHDFSSFTHLFTVSCTGMYAPGLDVDLIKALNLPPTIIRNNLNFMGCYAAVNALALANQVCTSNVNAKILIVSVELCSLHLQKTNNEDNLLAQSLFADGAAAAIVDSSQEMGSLEMLSTSSYLSLNGKNDMAWQIGDYGFKMALTSYVPDIIEGGIKELTNNLLLSTELNIEDIDLYAIHPGGKKILEAIEKQLGLSKEDNRYAYQILKNYGNMSSPTILFVLKELMKEQEPDKYVLSFAFGPGLTMESLLLKTR